MNIKINGNEYPLIAAYTTGTDAEWGYREAYYISLMMDHALAHELFVDGAVWSTIVDGDPATEIDHSDYCVAGKIIDYRNGRIEVLMGRKTETELLTAELTETRAALETANESNAVLTAENSDMRDALALLGVTGG